MQQGWFAWDASWSWSIALIALTVAMHATLVVFVVIALRKLKIGEPRERRHFFHTAPGAITVIVAVALILAVMHGLESYLWALVYLHLGAIATPADAVLYSVDSMTTRGASGLTLENHWLMMGAMEATDGMLLFGISTAFLFAVMQRTWRTFQQH